MAKSMQQQNKECTSGGQHHAVVLLILNSIKVRTQTKELPSGMSCIKTWHQSDAKMLNSHKISSPDNDSFYHTSALRKQIILSYEYLIFVLSSSLSHFKTGRLYIF